AACAEKVRFPAPVLKTILSSADSGLGELANEVHQNTTNWRARISAGGNEFGNANKRNNTLTGWQPSHCGGSGHDPTDRHDGSTRCRRRALGVARYVTQRVCCCTDLA